MSGIVLNRVRRGLYLDSVALMRVASAVKALPGVEDCGLMMATPANRAILAEAGVLASEGERAGPSDLVLAVRAIDRTAADAALRHARSLLDRPVPPGAPTRSHAPRTLRSAHDMAPAANLALISVPGAFAAAEARKVLARGLDVMLFSDNVPIGEEVALKREAATQAA